MTHDEITAKINAVPDSRRPSHVHRADYATDAEYSAAGVEAVPGKALIVKPVKITTAGGMTLVAGQADIMIYPALMRLNALWDMRHGLTRDTHYNHALPFHCIAGIEYAS